MIKFYNIIFYELFKKLDGTAILTKNIFIILC